MGKIYIVNYTNDPDLLSPSIYAFMSYESAYDDMMSSIHRNNYEILDDWEYNSIHYWEVKNHEMETFILSVHICKIYE